MILLTALWLAAAPPPEPAPASPEKEAPSTELLLYLGEFDDSTDPEELTDAMTDTETTDDDAHNDPPR